MENETVIEQPVDLTTLTPRYTAKTLELLDAAAAAQAKGQGSPFYMQVAYEEAHVPLFAAPEFQGVSRRGAYGDSMQQMDNSIGKALALDALTSDPETCWSFLGLPDVQAKSSPNWWKLGWPRTHMWCSPVTMVGQQQCAGIALYR